MAALHPVARQRRVGRDARRIVILGPFRRFSGGSSQASKLPPLLARHLSLFDEGAAFTACIEWLWDLDLRALEHDPEGRLPDRLIRFVNESDFLRAGA